MVLLLAFFTLPATMLAPEMWLMCSDERRARGKLWFKSCGAQALKVRARVEAIRGCCVGAGAAPLVSRRRGVKPVWYCMAPAWYTPGKG